MLVKSVDFLITFKCPAKCKHCSYKAGPERRGFIKPKKSSQYLKELVKMDPLQSVWIHGGEPFLYFEYLEKILTEAKQKEIPKRGLITNCFWAKNEKIAALKLKRLKEAGLTTMTFSFDCFHQEFIPLDCVKNALKAAVALGFEAIYLDSYFVESLDSVNDFNRVTKENLKNLGELKGINYHQMIMSLEGRGADLSDYINPSKEIPSGKCPVPFWIDGDFQNPETIEIDCEGNVTLCPGICIGNTNIQSLTNIIKNYNIENHPILSIVWKEGPIGLLKIAEEHGFKLDQKYKNECHLCYKLRKFLQPIYPYSLAPKECY
ncbi:MAG: radical SAM protein [Promethearchaeota archaeon]